MPKTAMQEMFDFMKDAEYVTSGMNVNIKNRFLELEKQQITKGYIQGAKDYGGRGDLPEYATTYYNKTYSNQ
jgi:hypothetical protein